jgi:hypothetical protein
MARLCAALVRRRHAESLVNGRTPALFLQIFLKNS